MKKYFIFLSLILTLTGCSHYLQVYDVKSPNAHIDDGKLVFENDTVKISYSFWAEYGVMAFSIYNKLDKPIFVDWKLSSYITNDNKLNYWQDEQETNSSSNYKSYFYQKGNPFLSNHIGSSETNSKTIKPERLTFIPPKSNYYRYQFYLSNGSFPLGKNFDDSSREYFKYTPALSKKEKTETLKFYNRSFTFNNSPLKFRNYIAFCFAENSHDYIYIDNNFYVSNIREMNEKNFNGAVMDYKGDNAIYDYPFKNKASFYIDLGQNKTISKR